MGWAGRAEARSVIGLRTLSLSQGQLAGYCVGFEVNLASQGIFGAADEPPTRGQGALLWRFLWAASGPLDLHRSLLVFAPPFDPIFPACLEAGLPRSAPQENREPQGTLASNPEIIHRILWATVRGIFLAITRPAWFSPGGSPRWRVYNAACLREPHCTSLPEVRS